MRKRKFTLPLATRAEIMKVEAETGTETRLMTETRPPRASVFETEAETPSPVCYNAHFRNICSLRLFKFELELH